MNYYIIINENELQIIPISPEQENAFIARYGGQVIICGNSITAVLIKFDELPVIITQFISH